MAHQIARADAVTAAAEVYRAEKRRLYRLHGEAVLAIEEYRTARRHMARRSEMRTIDRELLTMHIEATDQDQEVRREYYSSTPDGLAKDDGGMDADERLRREAINTQ